MLLILQLIATVDAHWGLEKWGRQCCRSSSCRQWGHAWGSNCWRRRRPSSRCRRGGNMRLPAGSDCSRRPRARRPSLPPPAGQRPPHCFSLRTRAAGSPRLLGPYQLPHPNCRPEGRVPSGGEEGRSFQPLQRDRGEYLRWECVIWPLTAHCGWESEEKECQWPHVSVGGHLSDGQLCCWTLWDPLPPYSPHWPTW